jgi:hypothetical protein
MFAGRRFPRQEPRNCSIVNCIGTTLGSFDTTCLENFFLGPSSQRLLQEVQGGKRSKDCVEVDRCNCLLDHIE